MVNSSITNSVNFFLCERIYGKHFLSSNFWICEAFFPGLSLVLINNNLKLNKDKEKPFCIKINLCSRDIVNHSRPYDLNDNHDTCVNILNFHQYINIGYLHLHYSKKKYASCHSAYNNIHINWIKIA